MSYRFIYNNSEALRVIPSVLIDNRANIPEIKNKVGTVIKAFTDAQVAMVTNSTIHYKIETEDGGNLAGYFTLQLVRAGVVVLLQFELRPAFLQFSSIISAEISTFMQSGNCFFDTL